MNTAWLSGRNKSIHDHVAPLRPNIKYRPDIDGLRAIADLAVLFYHVGLTEFPGGFVGVDIFFVISGFLITASVKEDLERNDFSLIYFYDRRMRRIFPALFIMLFLLAIVLYLYAAPHNFTEFGKSLVATALFASNIYFSLSGTDAGYFEKTSDDQFLIHTWSLSVEEQFYIFFPIALVLAHRVSDKIKLRLLVVLCTVSFAYSIIQVNHNRVDAFYSVFSRAWELLLGSLLTFGVNRSRFLQQNGEVVALSGAAAIAAAFSLAKQRHFLEFLLCCRVWEHV